MSSLPFGFPVLTMTKDWGEFELLGLSPPQYDFRAKALKSHQIINYYFTA